MHFFDQQEQTSNGRVDPFSSNQPQKCHLDPGGGTGENVENHVRENIGWILFKTRNFYIFLDIQ